MTETPDRSQSGLDRLLVFVVAVVVVVFLVPHLLGLVGIDVRGPADPGTPSDHDLTVLAVQGEAIDDGSVGQLRVVVAPAHDRAPVDLREGSVIVGTSAVYSLAPAGTDTTDADGTYTAAAIDGGGSVLESPTDRGVIRIDLGTNNVADAAEVGERLGPGQGATITLVSPRGERLTRHVVVPESVPAGTERISL